MTARNQAFISDREREILEAVTRMATSNPFAPERIEQERRALGKAFTSYDAVWHMDGDIEGLNPNVVRLRELAEGMAEDLRLRLVRGARPGKVELALYEGFVRYLLFYRYSPELTRVIHEREQGTHPFVPSTISGAPWANTRANMWLSILCMAGGSKGVLKAN